MPVNRVCAVSYCRANKISSKIKFDSPKDPEIKQKWIDSLQNHCKAQRLQLKHLYVCSNHFSEEDLGYFVRNGVKSCRLKCGAVPTIFKDYDNHRCVGVTRVLRLDGTVCDDEDDDDDDDDTTFGIAYRTKMESNDGQKKNKLPLTNLDPDIGKLSQTHDTNISDENAENDDDGMDFARFDPSGYNFTPCKVILKRLTEKEIQAAICKRSGDESSGGAICDGEEAIDVDANEDGIEKRPTVAEYNLDKRLQNARVVLTCETSTSEVPDSLVNDAVSPFVAAVLRSTKQPDVCIRLHWDGVSLVSLRLLRTGEFVKYAKETSFLIRRKVVDKKPALKLPQTTPPQKSEIEAKTSTSVSEKQTKPVMISVNGKVKPARPGQLIRRSNGEVMMFLADGTMKPVHLNNNKNLVTLKGGTSLLNGHQATNTPFVLTSSRRKQSLDDTSIKKSSITIRSSSSSDDDDDNVYDDDTSRDEDFRPKHFKKNKNDTDEMLSRPQRERRQPVRFSQVAGSPRKAGVQRRRTIRLPFPRKKNKKAVVSLNKSSGNNNAVDNNNDKIFVHRHVIWPSGMVNRADAANALNQNMIRLTPAVASLLNNQTKSALCRNNNNSSSSNTPTMTSSSSSLDPPRVMHSYVLKDLPTVPIVREVTHDSPKLLPNSKISYTTTGIKCSPSVKIHHYVPASAFTTTTTETAATSSASSTLVIQPGGVSTLAIAKVESLKQPSPSFTSSQQPTINVVHSFQSLPQRQQNSSFHECQPIISKVESLCPSSAAVQPPPQQQQQSQPVISSVVSLWSDQTDSGQPVISKVESLQQQQQQQQSPVITKVESLRTAASSTTADSSVKQIKQVIGNNKAKSISRTINVTRKVVPSILGRRLTATTTPATPTTLFDITEPICLDIISQTVPMPCSFDSVQTIQSCSADPAETVSSAGHNQLPPVSINILPNVTSMSRDMRLVRLLDGEVRATGQLPPGMTIYSAAGRVIIAPMVSSQKTIDDDDLSDIDDEEWQVRYALLAPEVIVEEDDGAACRKLESLIVKLTRSALPRADNDRSPIPIPSTSALRSSLVGYGGVRAKSLNTPLVVSLPNRFVNTAQSPQIIRFNMRQGSLATLQNGTVQVVPSSTTSGVSSPKYQELTDRINQQMAYDKRMQQRAQKRARGAAGSSSSDGSVHEDTSDEDYVAGEDSDGTGRRQCSTANNRSRHHKAFLQHRRRAAVLAAKRRKIATDAALESKRSSLLANKTTAGLPSSEVLIKNAEDRVKECSVVVDQLDVFALPRFRGERVTVRTPVDVYRLHKFPDSIRTWPMPNISRARFKNVINYDADSQDSSSNSVANIPSRSSRNSRTAKKVKTFNNHDTPTSDSDTDSS